MSGSPERKRSLSGELGQSSSPPKRLRDLSLSPPGSPPGSPRQRVDSVFADVCPRLGSDAIQEAIFEEMLRLKHRDEIPAYTLDANNPLLSFDHLKISCEKIMFERDAYLRAEYSRALNLKLAEQHEALVTLTNEQLRTQFKDAGDPSYLM